MIHTKRGSECETHHDQAVERLIRSGPFPREDSRERKLHGPPAHRHDVLCLRRLLRDERDL
jgi:hypothetical protein